MAENIVPADLITANDKTPLKNLSYGTDTNGTTRITLYAIWDATEYPVNIDINDVSSTQDPVNPSENNIGTYTIEDSFTLQDPSMTGYTFLGWTGSNGTVPGEASIARGTTGEKSYKANWRANNYTVRYDYNDSSEHGTLPSEQDVVFDETVTFAANDLTKDDAIVHHEKIARIYFDANGGTATQDSTEVTTEYDMGTEYRANGWTYPLYDGTEGHGTSAKNLTAVDGKTVILKPYWDLIVNSVEPAITCYTTTTGESGGTQVTAQKTTLHEKELFNGIYSGKYYQYRDKVTAYTFNGWWTSKTGGSQVTSFAAPSGSGDNNNKTVYAHYTEAVTYDYSIYPSNGTVIYPPSSGSYGTWNGSSKGPGTLTGASASGTTTASDAWTYTAYYTPKSGYCWADGTRVAKTITWSIGRASLSYPTAGYYTYNGTTQGPGYKSYMEDSGTTEAINAGSYTAYYTPDDNHCWSNGTYGQRSLSWSISKATVNASTLVDQSWTYTGSSHSLPSAPTGSTRSASTTSITNVGSITGTYTLKDKSNYEWSTGGTANKTVTYTVTKADQTWTASISPQSIEEGKTGKITISGTTYGTVTYTTSNSTYATVSSGTVTAKKATTSTVKITVTAAGDTNHNSLSKVVTVTIKEGKIPGTDIPKSEVNNPEYWFFKGKYTWNIGGSDTDSGNPVAIYDVLLTNDAMKDANGNWVTSTESYRIWKGYIGNWSAVGEPVEMADYTKNATVSRYFGHCKDINVGSTDTTIVNARNTIHAYKSGTNYYYIENTGNGVTRIVDAGTTNPLTPAKGEWNQKVRLNTTSFNKKILNPW